MTSRAGDCPLRSLLPTPGGVLTALGQQPPFVQVAPCGWTTLAFPECLSLKHVDPVWHTGKVTAREPQAGGAPGPPTPPFLGTLPGARPGHTEGALQAGALLTVTWWSVIIAPGRDTPRLAASSLCGKVLEAWAGLLSLLPALKLGLWVFVPCHLFTFSAV